MILPKSGESSSPSAPLDRSAPQFLEALIAQAEKAGASDVHLHMTGKAARVIFRLDGVMTAGDEIPADLAERVFGRIKYLARLKTYEESIPQDGRIPKEEIGAGSDIRVATYPTVTGEKIVLRLFSQTPPQPLRGLDFPEDAVLTVERFLQQASGLMLLTGPAGSGKTTTIYSCLHYLVSLGGRHIITVEDPVEQIVPGVMQTEINETRGLTFARAARHLLRQDPQALVLGEIRDEETANLAVRATLTGHLVIATLHAGSCRGVFERLLVICEDQHAALAGLKVVMNQRLMRRVCAACAGQGCPACLGTGYRGRIPILEWVTVDDSLRASLQKIGPLAIDPNPALLTSARDLCLRGMSNEAECRRLFGEPGKAGLRPDSAS